ncbi:MAG: RNA-directed DNA polymerase [Odoribacter sp.]|nr:RNA-directed DNA polymerase [Odoribacter sp.]
MKRAGYLTERIADTDNLLLAYYKASRGKRMKEESRCFSVSLDKEVARLRATILSGKVEVGDYTYFWIHDPKLRMICAAGFGERVLHHAIMNVCHPYFERQLIETTYATRPGKGIYQAIASVGCGVRQYGYVAKFDFRKYFDTIDHAILKVKLRRIFKDSRLLGLFDRIIDSYSRAEGKGLPIGNLTSQYFANYYLSSLDHYVKEELRVKEYVRYMDDFLIFASTREELEHCVGKVRCYASSELDLTLKPVVYSISNDGVSFLGYTVYPHKVLLNGRSKRRLKMKMREYDFMRETGEWEEKSYMEHITPLLAFAGYGYTKSLRRRLLGERQRT